MVAEDLVVGLEDRGEDADVELEAAGEEDRILGLGEVGEAALDSAEDGVIAADETGGGGSGGEGEEAGEGGVVGEAEVVVAAETEYRAAVEAVADTLVLVDSGERAGEARLSEGFELGSESAVERAHA